jgi:ParB family chromosome partitioning protein
MGYDFRLIPLERVDTADHTFRITTTIDKDELIASIREFGVLQPVVLVDHGPVYQMVSGFRRVDACHRLRLDHVPARILPPDTAPSECAGIAIADNTCQRSLNVVEQSRAYGLIRQFAANRQARRAMAQSVGLPDSQAAMTRIAPVADMSTTLHDAILRGNIALPVALQIIRLDTNDANAMIGLFQTVAAGLNVQRELFDLLSDISRRDGITIATLLEQILVAAAPTDTDAPSPQHLNQLRQILKKKRYPALSLAESDFRQAVKSLSLDTRVKIEPPRFFEGRSFRISLTVETREQLKRLQSELSKLTDHPGILPHEYPSSDSPVHLP